MNEEEDTISIDKHKTIKDVEEEEIWAVAEHKFDHRN